MSKRTASTELNHDNWCDEEEPEKAGTFKRASAEALKERTIRTARRRGVTSTESTETNSDDQGGTKSIFAGFGGFKKAEPSSAKAVFSFLAAPNNGGSTSNTLASSATVTGSPAGKDDKLFNGVENQPEVSVKANSDKEYYRKLKGLNESVSKWISTHVASNPLCILTPVFKDYEAHLANIQKSHLKDDSKTNEGNSIFSKHTSEVSVKDCSSMKESNKGFESVSIFSKRAAEDSSSDCSTIKGGDKTTSTDIKDKSEEKSTDEKKSFTSAIFGVTSSPVASSATFSFGTAGSSSPAQSQFCFGSSNTSTSPSSTPAFSFGTGGATSPSAGYSFGAGKPFTFANVVSAHAATEESKEKDDEAEEYTPPKPDHKPVTEEGATYTKRCKVFIKQGKEYSDRGIGNLLLKPVDGGKTQLIVRADTSLGNILLNFLVSSTLPVQRIGTNNVAVVCIPTPDAQPPPVTVLLRVKTSDDADELLETLENIKKAP